MGEKTFVMGLGMMAAFPVTMSTAMVSPRALPVPRMMAAVIPEKAEGITTRLMVCHRVAPMARLPSRNSRGTALMASSETEVMVGRAMTARRMDPASQVRPDARSKVTRRTSVRIIRPKKPYTTDGIPARSSMAGLRTLLVREEAISAVKTAHPRERGMAMAMAPRVTRIVPAMRGRVPYSGGVPVGSQVPPVMKFPIPTSGKMGEASRKR